MIAPPPGRRGRAPTEGPAAAPAPRLVFHLHDRTPPPPPTRSLARGWTVVAVQLRSVAERGARLMRNVLIEVDITTRRKAVAVKGFLSDGPRGGRRIFACPRGDRHAAIQAGAFGATDIVDLPVTDEALLAILSREEPGEAGLGQPASGILGSMALDVAFGALTAGAPLRAAQLASAAEIVASDVAGIGIEAWLRSIRSHHTGTYQHCLIVTGIAAAFGQALGLSRADLDRLTVAALLHDIGKARIDTAILDKPGRLTAEEFATVKMHPVWGEEHLRARSDLPAEVRDAVRHHHEYLDGSGYPDGLSGGGISDLTRLVTIADVFGALVEERSYKLAMPAEEAFAQLLAMAGDGKLEGALVNAFRPVAAGLAAAPS